VDSKLKDIVNVNDFGAKGDGIFVTGLISATAASTTLNAASTAFVSGDVGKVITVPGAGAAGADLTTTIATVINAGSVTLAVAATTTVNATVQLFYGSNNSTAFQNAYNAVGEGGSVVIPVGNYALLT